jgi:gliding motility-associated-like protein
MKKLLPLLLSVLGMFASAQQPETHRSTPNTKQPNQILWDEVEPIKNGFARVLKDGYFTFINREHKALTTPQFEGARNFSNHLAAVQQQEKWGFLNEAGNLVVPCVYDLLFDMGNQFTTGLKDGKWYILNTQGKVLSAPKIDVCRGFENGLAMIEHLGQTGRMNKEGVVSFYGKTKSVSITQARGPVVNNANTTACPNNIDFENGNFTNWRTYTGTVDSIGTRNVITVAPSAPVANRHRIITRANPSAMDFFGLFPTNPPDGSNYAVRLGNTNIGAQAERIAYTIRVPQNDSNFSIKYNYAVVFQDPGHTAWSQPRFTARLLDSATNSYIDCYSYEYISTSNLPGFARSTVDTSVIYKPWSSVYISLRRYAGRTLYLEFTTADCVRRGHWGYAYVDIENSCGQSASAQYDCNYPHTTTLVGPPGFQAYNWWSAGYTTLLATGQNAVLNPGPAAATNIFLEMIPYNSFGCRDTLMVPLNGGFTPSFQASETIVACAPHSITFTNQNQPATSVVWNFGDGTTGNGDVVTHTYTQVGTYIVTMNVTLPSGCSGTATDTVVITQPNGSFSYTGGNICNGNNIQFVINAQNYLNYTLNLGDGTSVSNQPIVNHTYTIAGTYQPSLTVNYAGGCQQIILGTDSIKIENLIPGFSHVANATCNNVQVDFNSTSTSTFGIQSYSWTFGDGTSANGENVSHTYTTSGNYMIKLKILGSSGCVDSIVRSINVVLLSPPVLNISSLSQVCASTPISFTSNVNTSTPITSFVWTASNGTVLTGDSVAFTFNQVGTYNITAVATNANGCSDTATRQIVVKPLPQVNALNDQTLCTGVMTNPVIFSSNLPNAIFTWQNDNTDIGLAASGNGNIPSFNTTNNSSATLIANVVATASLNGCSSSSPAMSFMINPIPEAIQPPNQALCNRASTDPVIFSSFTSAVAAATYTWTNNTPSIGLAASGSGNIYAFTAINNGIVPVIATVTITPTNNGCSGLPVDFTYTVNPTPNLNLPPNQQVCNGNLSNIISFTGSTGADIYNWTNNTPSIGLPVNGMGDIRPFVASNNTFGPITANISVYPVLNGCAGDIQYFDITVNPTPSMAQPNSQQVCSGSTTAAVIFTGTISGTQYNWSNSLTSIGLQASGSGDILAFNPINNGIDIDTANIIVTPVFNGCPGTPRHIDLVVMPQADLTQPLNQFVCNGQQTSLINFNGPVAGTTFTWNNNNPSIGLSASGSGFISPFTTLNNTNTAQTATITVTASANNCPGNVKTFDIHVDPTPAMTQPVSLTVCNASIIDSILFNGTVAGTNFSWINNNTSIGLAANGNGMIPSFTAINNTYAPVVANIAVIGSANSCNSATSNFSITINPSVNVDSIPDQMVCNRGRMSAISITGPVSGTSFRWINDNPSIGLAANGNGDIPAFDAINPTNLAALATITVYGESADQCAAAIKVFKIFVNPTPLVAADNDINICRGSSSTMNVTGASTYSWSPAVGLSCVNCANPIVNAAVTTNYIVEGTSVNGCKGYDTVVVAVAQPFNMIVSPNDTLCIGSNIQLRANRASRYQWSPAAGLSDATIANPIATPGVSTMYRVVGYDQQNCFTDTGYVYLAVAQTPTVNAGADIEAATGTQITLSGTAGNGPVTSWNWSPATNLSCDNCPNPVLTVSNNITYTLSVVNRYGCKAVDSLNVVTFCKNSQVFVANAFTPDGDGVNDLLIVRGIGIRVKSFRVFNRWGNLVFEKLAFEANDPKFGWDGKVRGVPAAPDVYVFLAEVVCDNGTVYLHKGNTTILK